MAFQITTQDQFNDCLLWISDLSKDAYGFRVRNTDWASMSFEELAAEVNRFSAIVEENEAEERAASEKALADFEARVEELINSGAGDRETAIRWIVSAYESVDLMYGGSYICYDLGIRSRELEQELDMVISKLEVA